jgi:hypothetical protein
MITKELDSLKEQVSKLSANANVPKLSDFVEFAKKFNEISEAMGWQGHKA